MVIHSPFIHAELEEKQTRKRFGAFSDVVVVVALLLANEDVCWLVVLVLVAWLLSGIWTKMANC